VISLRLRRGDATEDPTGGLLSYTDWARRDVKWLFGSAQMLLLVLLVLIGLGPLVWLAKGAVTPTIDTLRNPLALFPHGVAWSNLSDAWSKVNVGRYFWNTIVLALGSWFCQIVVATTGAFVLSVLRPAWGRLVNALLLGTLFVPVVVLIVPLYIEVVHPPLIHHSFAESYWAIWLPAGASAFNVVLMKRFFDNLPQELFEAARIDGARSGTSVLFDRVTRSRSRSSESSRSSRSSRSGRTSSGRSWSSRTARIASRCQCGFRPSRRKRNSVSSLHRC